MGRASTSERVRLPGCTKPGRNSFLRPRVQVGAITFASLPLDDGITEELLRIAMWNVFIGDAAVVVDAALGALAPPQTTKKRSIPAGGEAAPRAKRTTCSSTSLPGELEVLLRAAGFDGFNEVRTYTNKDPRSHFQLAGYAATGWQFKLSSPCPACHGPVHDRGYWCGSVGDKWYVKAFNSRCKRTHLGESCAGEPAADDEPAPPLSDGAASSDKPEPGSDADTHAGKDAPEALMVPSPPSATPSRPLRPRLPPSQLPADWALFAPILAAELGVAAVELQKDYQLRQQPKYTDLHCSSKFTGDQMWRSPPYLFHVFAFSVPGAKGTPCFHAGLAREPPLLWVRKHEEFSWLAVDVSHARSKGRKPAEAFEPLCAWCEEALGGERRLRLAREAGLTSAPSVCAVASRGTSWDGCGTGWLELCSS